MFNNHKILLHRVDTYTHTELFDTSAAWDRVLSLIVDDMLNLEDEDLSNLVYDTVSDLSTSGQQDVMTLLKDPHIGSMFILEYDE